MAYQITTEQTADAGRGWIQRGVMLRRVAESATQAYRDTLENVCRPHADQMASRPFDPLPLSKSEERLIENMRLQAQHCIERYDTWLAQHNVRS